MPGSSIFYCSDILPMGKFFRRFFLILGINTLLAIFIAVVSSAFSIYFDWKIDFPLTIIGIAVVFPVVFSIGGAYNRRESALAQYAIMKSMGRVIYLAARDWLRDTDERSINNKENFKNQVTNVFTLCIEFFHSPVDKDLSEQEAKIYKEFSLISNSIEGLSADCPEAKFRG